MKNEICIGMAGAGRATELHINALKRFTGIPLRFKMIVARRKEQLEVAKAIYGFEETSYDFEDLLTDPDIDVIDICTPPYVHEEMIERAMLAGKHVICEKPFTSRVEELEELSQLAKEKNLFLLEAISRLYLSNVLKIKEKLSELGKIKIVTAIF